MMLQLNPPIPGIAKGRKALAHVLIDYGPEYDLIWVAYLDNGECWAVPNPDWRADTNWTFKRSSVAVENERIVHQRLEAGFSHQDAYRDLKDSDGARVAKKLEAWESNGSPRCQHVNERMTMGCEVQCSKEANHIGLHTFKMLNDSDA